LGISFLKISITSGEKEGQRIMNESGKVFFKDLYQQTTQILGENSDIYFQK
jgi:hypothetical protein